MAKFETPEVGPFLETPKLRNDTMAHSAPFKAKEEHQEPLGFPGELVPDWHDKAIGKMGELLGKYRSLQVFLDSCVKCGACTDKCHYYLGTSDPKNMPVARQDLLQGLPSLFHACWQICSLAGGCGGPNRRRARRLVFVLPPVLAMSSLLGLLPLRHRHSRDIHGAREILDTVGVGPKYLEIIGKVHKNGNNLGLPEPAGHTGRARRRYRR